MNHLMTRIEFDPATKMYLLIVDGIIVIHILMNQLDHNIRLKIASDRLQV